MLHPDWALRLMMSAKMYDAGQGSELSIKELTSSSVIS